MSQEQMFCYQCEQTARGQGCTILGVCGKNPEVATLQDLLVHTLKGLSQVTIEARKAGVETEEVAAAAHGDSCRGMIMHCSICGKE